MKKGVRVIATGGGAHKYYDELVEGTGLSVQREEEMECLTTGLQFITSIPDEVFWYSDKLVYEISHRSTPSPLRTRLRLRGRTCLGRPLILLRIR